MPDTITSTMLQDLCGNINRALGTPESRMRATADGHFWNVGCYTLDYVHSGVALVQITDEIGSRRTVLPRGSSRRDLLDRMHAFYAGIEAAKAARVLA